ncbi:MAG: hypothetical protein KBT50_02070, partial [Cycloclasticus sp.]|nr:hypothetical protein [Cycloclasticus sp.]MBQ0789376.1 hypothetical protein [Cycloclasticus sp.]
KVTVQGLDNHYNVLTLSVMPNETLHIKPAVQTTVVVNAGSLKKTRGLSWDWTAPAKSGLYPISLSTTKGNRMTLNVFVLRPASEIKKGKLDGYRIGAYPDKPFKGLPTYREPKGYIEVNETNRSTFVSPHFTLEQFLCKLPAVNGKKFIVLQTTLLLKLEKILSAVNDRGFRTDSFFVMSGYRTPFYNRSIRSSRNSRHIYGGAADIYIDVAPQDEMMDDLNNDKQINRKDAAVLYDLIDQLNRQQGWIVGGLGEYEANHAHGPFVHVDSRGYRARWGKP